jgi:hypothetical protein
MRAYWYYNRLKSMGLNEILYRLRKLLWQITARILRNRVANFYKNSASHTTRIVGLIKQIDFYGLGEIGYNDIPDEWRAGIISAADKLLEHRYKCFALEDKYLGREICFNRELKRDIDMPLKFASWMDYRDTDLYGHFKYFWELGRFQHLVTLAKAYYLTGHEKYASEVAGQIKAFVRQCPYLLGVHWIIPMEAALRLISIVWIVSFMKNYLRYDVETCNLIEEIVTSHVDYIAENFSAYSSANNHLIGELTGVFVAGLCFKGLDRMSGYKQKAYDMLCREITLQFHADGVNREQTTHYHVSCYNCFLLAGLLGRKNDIEFPKEYWHTLEKAAEFICSLSNSNGSIFNIGDSDDGKTMVLSETEPNQVQSLLATAAALFTRGDFKTKTCYFDETSLWLLGKTGKAAFDALDADGETVGSERFQEGGYYILRGDGPPNPKVIFDCGPLGMGSIAAHGHADSLSFLLYAHEREFFIDPGTYTFEAESPYRHYLRSTAAHNTITIDGKDQSEMRGPFLWGHKACSFVNEWVDTKEYVRVTAWHDGFKRLDDPVIHRRTIKLDKKRNVVSIDDSIEAKSEHKICQYFHLAPECEIVARGKNNWNITNRGKTIALVVDDILDCELFRGSEAPIYGWVSKSYDTKVPTNTLVCRVSTKGKQCLSTTIVL